MEISKHIKRLFMSFFEKILSKDTKKTFTKKVLENYRVNDKPLVSRFKEETRDSINAKFAKAITSANKMV